MKLEPKDGCPVFDDNASPSYRMLSDVVDKIAPVNTVVPRKQASFCVAVFYDRDKDCISSVAAVDSPARHLLEACKAFVFTVNRLAKRGNLPVQIDLHVKHLSNT